MISMKRQGESYIMYDNDIILGNCDFSLINKTIYKFTNLSDISDKTVIINLAKAVLNFFDLHGVSNVKCLDTKNKEILTSIGFNDNLEICLIGYFDSPCSLS
ncbi:MAG: hypothetical protein RR073_00050 [Clostridia bacterium]